MAELSKALENVCSCEYPAKIETIRDQCYDEEVELRNGSKTTLGEILDTVEEPPEEFDSEIQLHNFLMSLAPEESIGRKYYDDRGGNNFTAERDQTSL